MRKSIYQATMGTIACVCMLGGCGQAGDQAQEMQSSDHAAYIGSVVIPDYGTVLNGDSASGNGATSGSGPATGSGEAASGNGVTSNGTSTSKQFGGGTDSIKEERMQAYEAALEKVYTYDVFPDGIQHGMPDDMYDKTNNCFAIFDIDFDGKDELIIQYTDTIVAGMVENIYDYDDVTGKIVMEFSEFPALTFYENGVVKADLSHNQGRGGEFWPYTVYKYYKESDAYVEAGGADAWDHNVSEKDADGNSFPADADVNGDGIVYYVRGGKYAETTIVDLEEYNQWWDSIVEGAEEIEIPYKKLKEYAQSYAVCTSKTAWEVERFARKIKEQILCGDFQGLSKEIAYPVTVNGITYQDEEAFLKADFIGKLNPEILEALEAESCRGMLANWQGIMLGDGCVWIGEPMNSDRTSQGLKVIALNRFTSTDEGQ